MKFAAVLAAAAVLATTANAAACPSTEIPRLLALANEPTLGACQTDSTFVFVPPKALPTAEQLELMCLSTNCKSTIAALRAIGPNDCDSTFSNGVTLNVKSVLDMYDVACPARRNLRN